MKDSLLNVFNEIDMDLRKLVHPDGTEMLILPHGGRVIGLFAPDSDDNFLWTNNALNSADSAHAMYNGNDWHNSGGDRTWLAPEIDLFYPNDPGNPDDYFQPREFDPGSYTIESDYNSIVMRNRFSVKPFSTKIPIKAEIVKSYSPAPNPLRYHVPDEYFSDVDYAGYNQHTSLILTDTENTGSASIGIWNLLQLPGKGDMIIPTITIAAPTVYFGSIPEDDLIVGNKHIRYKMRASGGQKIGVSAFVSIGRVGYLKIAGDKSTLVIRNFSADPSAEYVDVPWNEKKNPEFVFQACNINNELGCFSELEYHAGAIGGSTGLYRSDDSSQVWAFRGSYDKLLPIIHCLLTTEI